MAIARLTALAFMALLGMAGCRQDGLAPPDLNPRYSELDQDCPDCRAPMPDEQQQLLSAINQIGTGGGVVQCQQAKNYITSYLAPSGWVVSPSWLVIDRGMFAAHYTDHAAPHYIFSATRIWGQSKDLARSLVHETAHHMWGYSEQDAIALAYTCVPQ